MQINVMNDDGTLNYQAMEFEGMDRYEARKAIVEKLIEVGAFRGSEENAMSLAKCSRSGDVLEPLIKPQW